MNIHIYTTYSIFIKALAKTIKNPNLLGGPASCSWCEFPSILRRYSQSGNDQDEMVEIKKSRVSCYIFSLFMNNLIQWRKSEAGLAKPISDLFQTLMLF